MSRQFAWNKSKQRSSGEVGEQKQETLSPISLSPKKKTNIPLPIKASGSGENLAAVTPDDSRKRRLLDEETKLRVQVDVEKENSMQKTLQAIEREGGSIVPKFNAEDVKSFNQLNQTKVMLDAKFKEEGNARTLVEKELKTLAGLRDFVAAGELGEVKAELNKTATDTATAIESAGEGLTEPINTSLNAMLDQFDQEVTNLRSTQEALINAIQQLRYR